MVYDTEILVSPQATSIWIDSAATIMELSADIGLGWMGLWDNLPTSYACISIILIKVISDVQNIFLDFLSISPFLLPQIIIFHRDSSNYPN